MTKHTPGPWIVGSHLNRPAVMTGNRRIIVCGCYTTPDSSSSDSNARLISVAPNLLEDGKKLCNELAGIMGTYEFRNLVGNTNFTVLFQRWEAMRSAIAKAEGAE
jgi:hypothetical protein